MEANLSERIARFAPGLPMLARCRRQDLPHDVMRQAPSDPACAEPFQELLAVIKNAIG